MTPAIPVHSSARVPHGVHVNVSPRRSKESSGEGPIVVITGANDRFGEGMLTALVEDGYRFAGLDIRGDAIETLQDAHPDTVHYHDCDVTADADVERAVGAVLDDWGRIDILVTNAAVLNFGFFEDQSSQDLERVCEVNFFGYVRMVRAVLPYMRERDGGIIHNVSSGVRLVGNPGSTG